MKVKNPKDTAADALKKVTLIDGLNLSGSYNFLADSFQLSTFSIGARSNLFEKISITANATAAITIRPTVTDATATIKVKGVVVTSGTNLSVPLNVGVNTIAIVVAAQDTSIKKTYNIVVTRDKTTPVITFNTIPAKTYGNADFDPATSTNTETPVTYSSLNTAVATIVDGKIHIVGAGTSTITASQAADATHYAATNVNRQLTVEKATLTVTADDNSKGYGEALPILTASYSGFVNGETAADIDTLPALSTTATISSSVAGGPYIIHAANASDANYTISYVDGSLSVNPAQLTITVNDRSKVYGAPLPEFTADYGSIDPAVIAALDVSFSVQANAGSSVNDGPYAISASSLNPNYTLEAEPGTLTITPAPLHITAVDKVIKYNDPLPGFTATYTGFVNDEDETTLGNTLQFNTSGYKGANVAESPFYINPSDAVNPNYEITYSDGSLFIDPVALTVTVEHKERLYGADEPIFTATYDGFVNSDTEGVLNPPVFSTDATKTSPVGINYTITASGAANPNYIIGYVPGSLSITPAPLTITANNQTKLYGAPVPTLTASYSGFVNDEDTNNLLTMPSLSTTATATSPILGSPYSITAGGASAANYDISYVAGTLTVTGSSNAVLASLEFDPNIYKTGVSGSHYRDYTASVANSVTNIVVTATPQDAGATITVNNIAVLSGVASQPIQLDVASPTTINTVVTSSDGTATKTYSIVITRRPAANALLTSLELDPNIYKTGVSGNNYKDYTASVSNATNSIKLTAITQDANAIIRINDVIVASGVTSEPIALGVGTTTINTVVTAADGTTTKTYSIVITRRPATNALLSSFVLDPNIYKIGVTGSNYKNYTATVANTTSSVKIIAIPEDPNATVRVNEVVVASGVASVPVALGVGTTTINTVVTAADGVTIKTYSVIITRKAGSNALLSSLVLDPNIYKVGVTGANYRDYTASVANKTSSVKVTATTQDPLATVKINDVDVVSGVPLSVSLDMAITPINTVVTAADGTTIKTYSIVITRAGVNSARPSENLAIVTPVDNQEIASTEVTVSKAVSANGDGTNDMLEITGIESYPDNTLQIINSKGVSVTTFTNYDNRSNAFDGRNKNGALQPAGTYFYMLQYKDGKESKTKSGYFILKY
ncbi:MAG: hypothetical protein EOP51_19455 [Sphingobacteriales bacterium]|nr:MAG: hypothetical protein EOP51_19455 [Sphingobacteriales bacterium]